MRPDEKWQAEPGHTGRAHRVDSDDEVEARQNRGETIDEDAEDRRRDRGIRIDAAQRSVKRPARVQAAGAERIEHEAAANQINVPTQKIDFRKREVLCADHQWNQEISQYGGDRGNQEEEDHRHAVHGEQLVVRFRRNQVTRRREQVDADHRGEDAAHKEKERDRTEIEQGDALMVRGKQPRTEAVRGVQIILMRQFVDLRWRRRAHDLFIPRGRRDSGTFGGYRLRLQRLNVGDQSEDLLLRQLPLKWRHQRLIRGHNLCIGLQNRLPNIGLVGFDGGAVGQKDFRAIQTIQRWGAAGAIGEVASDASLLGKELLPGHDGVHLAASGTGEPRGIFRRFHDRDPATHHRVIRATILRTEEMVAAGLGGAKPHGVVVPGHHVHLHAERRNKEIVDDIFAREDQADVAPHGDMQLVDLLQAVGLLRLPHPLLGDDVNIERIERRAAKVYVDDSAPAEHGHGQNQGNDHPHGLETRITVDGNTDGIAFLAVVLEEENDNRRGDSDREEKTNSDEEKHQGIHMRSEVGRLFRIQWRWRLHGLVSSLKLGARPASVAAPENQNPSHDTKNRQDTAQADDLENRRAVSRGCRVVVKTKQQNVIDGRADLSGGGIHKPEAHIAAGILDAIEVTRDAAVRRKNHDAARVSEQIRFRVEGEPEIGSFCGRLDRLVRAGKEMPAGSRLWTAEVREHGFFLFRSHAGRLARIEADENNLVVAAGIEREHSESADDSLLDLIAEHRAVVIDEGEAHRLLAEIIGTLAAGPGPT